MTGRDLDRLAVRVRPVLPVAVPDPGRLVAGASVLDLVRAQRPLAPDHHQGARRLVEAAPATSIAGTRVFVEGPYGVLTGARRTRRRVLLIAGGIGITPLRALLEALPAAPGDMTLLYRAQHAADIVFRDELERWRCQRGIASTT